MSKSLRALSREIDPNDVLRAAGIPAAQFEPRHGWSNRTWVSGTHVVRISSGRLRGSLAHEHRMIELVQPRGIPVADVVARGEVKDLATHASEAGEWIVSRRLRGDTLASVWSGLDAAARRRIGIALGTAMRMLHHVPTAPTAPPWWIDAHRPALLRNAYRPRVALGSALIEAARELPDADHGLLHEAEAFLSERIGLFTNDTEVLVHGDLHGHNILVTRQPEPAVSGLLDWEGARTAAPDLELDMLLRWVTTADDFPQTPGAPSQIKPGDCLELIDHVAIGYPDLFAGPSLNERLEVYDALWHLVQLLFDAYWRASNPSATDSRSPTWGWFRALLDGESPLAKLRL